MYSEAHSMALFWWTQLITLYNSGYDNATVFLVELESCNESSQS